MDHVQITDDQRRAMLATLGVNGVEDLYINLPESIRLKRPLDLPPARSELEIHRELKRRGVMDLPAAQCANFLGGGAYDHFIPSVVDSLAGQRRFVTAYTPYQAEASQGSLQAFFEFQTQICRLTGLDVANASLYEGATAVAEAVMMAMNHSGKRRVLVASTLHPHYRAVLGTYLADLPADLIELPANNGVIEAATVRERLDHDTACVVVQSPNVFGLIEDWFELFRSAHEQDKTLAIAVFNPIACGLLKRPGESGGSGGEAGGCGADIAAGEGQPLGVPLAFGGPWLGLFAARQSLMRKMPGRLVGQTVDKQGHRGFCLTLQTREQHIRGAKATSNVCTNQGLLALRATIYLSAVGPDGLREVATQCYHKAHHAATRIAELEGYHLAYDRPFFHEFVVQCPVTARSIIDAGRECAILPGLDCQNLGIGAPDQLLVAVTEKRTAEDIEMLVDLLAKVA